MSSAKATQTALERAVQSLIGHESKIIRHATRAWASITFSGTMHRIDLIVEGVDALEPARAFEDALPHHEFAIAGHLVADAGVIETETNWIGDAAFIRMTAEILLLKED